MPQANAGGAQDSSSDLHMPTLTIIIPTYNAGLTITRCLESIQQQLYKDYEIVIQDGNSSDNTPQLIAAFRKIHPDCLIRYFQASDRGVYDAMNKAIQEAQGHWVYFLGSDDQLFSDSALQDLLATSPNDDVGVLYGNVQMVHLDGSNAGSLYDGLFTLKKLLTKNMAHQSMIYRKAVLAKVGFYDLTYRSWADWDYNMRCWSVTRFAYVDVTVARFQLGGLSSHDDGIDRCFESDAAEKAMKYFRLSALHPLINRESFVGWKAIQDYQHRRFAGYHILAALVRVMQRFSAAAARRLRA